MLRFFSTMSSVIKIDGSLGEGGGQVLRIALSLSTLYKIPIEITNIRAGRPKPGLSAQHLKGIEIVKDMCNADVEGAHIGSTYLKYKPGPFDKHKQKFEARVKTAGCITLLAQVALPCALFLPSDELITLIFEGGTNVPMGPHIEYFTEVFKPFLNQFGADFEFVVLKRGYYPSGGGEVHLFIKPLRSLNSVHLTDPGIPEDISGWAYVAGSIDINAATRMANDFKDHLTRGMIENNIPVPSIEIEEYREDESMANKDSSGMTVVCTTSTGCIFGGSALGTGGNKETAPGVAVANEILDPIVADSCVDEHLQDQMILLMALAEGFSKIKLGSKKLTCHAQTAIEVAEIMLKDRGLRFNLSENSNEDNSPCYVLECEGCGLVNEYFNN